MKEFKTSEAERLRAREYQRQRRQNDPAYKRQCLDRVSGRNFPPDLTVKELRCSVCWEVLSVEFFTPDRRKLNGYSSWCRNCKTTRRRQDYHKSNDDSRDKNLRSKYGISLEEFVCRLRAQGGGCAICGRTNPGRRHFSVDHDHACCPGNRSCGRCIRGILCGPCNSAIGLLGDDPVRADSAASYLRVRVMPVMP